MALRAWIVPALMASVAAVAVLWPREETGAPVMAGAERQAQVLGATEASAPGEPEAAAAVEGQAAEPAPNPPGTVLVRFERGAAASERAQARGRAGAEFEQSLPLPGLQLVDPQPGRSAAQVAQRLERAGVVRYAEPDFERSIEAMPNDSHIGLQWGLHNVGQTVAGRRGTSDADIDAPEAWDVSIGSAGIAVGVVDSGVDYRHADLAPNVWANPGESGGGRESNGVDDDANGVVDDWRGWDWVERDNAPLDPHGHGTHVAGTIGARGNDGAGVAGVAWQVGLVPLRVLDDEGSGRVSDAISAYAYAGRKQLRIVNASLGGASFSRAERDAIAAAPDTLFVVAAGNEETDNDVSPTYPCNYDLANVLCVAASDRDDGLAGFSNYGPTTVDLAAPGSAIASTWPDGGWVYSDGTSMATPHVAGAAALAWASAPEASVADVRAALLDGVDPRPALLGRTVSGGRLNARRALAALAGSDADADGEPPAPAPEPAPSAPPPASAPVVPAPAPAPAPAVPQAPGTPHDTAAPRVAVAAPARTRLLVALRRGIAVRTRCSERCTFRHRLLAPPAAARRLSIRGGRRTVAGAARGGVAATGRAGVRIRIRPHIRRRLRRVPAVRLRLLTRAVDAAGNAAIARRAVALRR